MRRLGAIHAALSADQSARKRVVIVGMTQEVSSAHWPQVAGWPTREV
jgi:hypothetical protein